MRAELAPMVVSPDATIMGALEAINRGGHAIAFVCDRQGRVLGTLTDGDIRRALLGGANLNDQHLRKVMRRDFRSVGPSADRSEVLDLMRARWINQLPVVDGRGRLVGLHVLQEVLGVIPRPNWAVIMAGGRGTRLAPITETVPKPMIPVAGRPIIERLILHLVGWGITRIFISVNHLAEVIEDHFGDGSALGCRIQYLRERKPLGTGGSLSLLPVRPRSPVLVMNGDLVTQVDIGRMLALHERGRYAATIGVRPHAVQIPFGVVHTKGERLIQIAEKPTQRVMINAGIYILSPHVLRLVPRRQEFPITELFQRCLERGLKTGVYLIDDEWLDVGRPDDLRRARGDL